MSKNKINILIITVRADFGGGPEHIYSLVKALNEENNFFIACPDDIPYKKRYAEVIGNDRMILIPYRKFNLKNLFKLNGFIHKHKIGIIHSHGKGAGVYGRILSLITITPCVHTFHGWHTGSYNFFQKFIYVYFEKFLSFFTKKSISVSKGEYEEVVKNRITKPSKIVIIENAVKIPDTAVTEQNFNSTRKTITSFTRFNYQKNSKQIISIFEELKKQNCANTFKINLLGSGEEENEMKKSVEDYGFDGLFNFLGVIEEPDNYLIDTFCYISTSRWEGMPLGILEAMSFGIPVIATNVVGNNDIVEHKMTGFLYDINKPAEAAEYLILLSNNFEIWKSLSAASRERVKKDYSIEKMATETQKIYNSILLS